MTTAPQMPGFAKTVNAVVIRSTAGLCRPVVKLNEIKPSVSLKINENSSCKPKPLWYCVAMKTNNALKTLANKNIVVIEPTTTAANYNRSLYAVANGHRLMITTQGEEVSTMRVAPARENDDPQSDYFAGSYWDTMPQIFRAMGIA